MQFDISKPQLSFNYCSLREQGVFSVDKEKGLKLEEVADGVTVQQVVEATECEFDVAKPLKPMKQVPVPPGIVTTPVGGGKAKKPKAAAPAPDKK